MQYVDTTSLNMKAIYVKSVDGADWPNPLLDALPALQTEDEVLTRLANFPSIPTPDERQLPKEARAALLSRIQQVFQPLTYHFELERAVTRAIRGTYRFWNPYFPENLRAVDAGANSLRDYRLVQPTDSSLTRGFAYSGDSGLGKSVTMGRILAMIPPVIHHQEYRDQPFFFTQVPWVKINCPPDSSTRGLCLHVFGEYDSRLGTNFTNNFGKSRATKEELLSRLIRVVLLHGTGLLVIDEVQNLASAKSGGADEMLAFFSHLMHRLNIAVVLIGTAAAVGILTSQFSQARRATGYARPIWTRLARNDPDWEILIASLWRYQFLHADSALTVEINDVFHRRTQGIPDVLAKLFLAVQERVIFEEAEIITAQIVDAVADRLLPLIEPHLEVMRRQRLPNISSKRGADYTMDVATPYAHAIAHPPSVVQSKTSTSEFGESPKVPAQEDAAMSASAGKMGPKRKRAKASFADNAKKIPASLGATVMDKIQTPEQMGGS